MIGTGPHDIFRRVRQQRSRVIIRARFERLRPSLLDHIVGADIGLHEQRVDGRASIIQLGYNGHRVFVNRDDVFDVVNIARAGRRVVLNMRRPRVGHILRRHRGVVTPLRHRFQMEGEFSAGFVPFIRSIGQ